MKILIIGIGNIGKSHLKSFFISKKNYTIYLYDKLNNSNFSIESFNSKKIKIINLKNFPKSLDLDLVIVSTNSLERFHILKKLIANNKIKFLILEKYIFTKLEHYKKAKILFKNKSKKIFINVWGSLVANLLKIKIDRRKKLIFKVAIGAGRMMTNAIHYLDFFSFLTENKINLSINIKKVIKSKRKKYSEILGDIYGYNKIGKIKISSQKIITDKINIFNGKDKYLVKIAFKNKCYLYKNSKFLRKIDFPFSYIYTCKIFENYFLNKKNSKIFSNFNNIFNISENIIRLLKTEKKQINIT
jgi:hypothetical protein